MDMLVDRVGKVEGTVVAVQVDISEMRPGRDDVKRWKLMGIGALAVIGIGGMAMGVTFAEGSGRSFWGARNGGPRSRATLIAHYRRLRRTIRAGLAGYQEALKTKNVRSSAF
jgi:hypothetical protein